MKVYTKKGDKGTTSILGQNNVDKDDLRIEAYGTVDELNTLIGQLGCLTNMDELKTQFFIIQNSLFTVGSELASTPETFLKLKLDAIDSEEIKQLEQWIDEQTMHLPELKSFILPGGCVSNSIAHQARTVCRRAERRCVSLNKTEPLREEVIQYLNRLSDYLFTVARFLSYSEKATEIEWRPKKK
ncbi:MAG: cob(I)yrinic acid a,c-diamide adenosyltransferase [Flavobacteriales bacterium]|nr:cob(I)yrinic acid a,c-diamide adenosyltransferase [Flavobacteriales bacterium]